MAINGDGASPPTVSARSVAAVNHANVGFAVWNRPAAKPTPPDGMTGSDGDGPVR